MSIPATATLKQFAAIAGFRSVGRVHELRKEGKLVLTDDGLVRVAESIALIAATRDPSKAGVVERHAAERAAKEAAQEPASDSDDSAQAEALPSLYGSHAERRAKALADDAEESARRKRRENEIEEGRLLWRDQIEPAIGQAFGRLRQALESTAHELAPELAAIDDEDRVIAVLTDRYERLLGNLSRDLAGLAQQGAA